MKVLNLYSGLGGNRKLWEEVDVTAVEDNEEIARAYADNFPNDKVIVADAHQYLLDHYDEYDFIWTSPPCPTHSKIRLCGVHRGQCEAVYPDMRLYQEVIFLMYYPPKNTKWIVENVHGFYTPLVPYTKKIDRHICWSNFAIPGINIEMNYDTVRNSIGLLEDHLGFDISGYDLENPLKALRSCVHPEIGKYIMERAKGIYRKRNEKQMTLL